MIYHDELCSLMRDTTWRTPYADIRAMADNIVAAGWGPADPAEVPTWEELDAYPVGSVIVDGEGTVYARTTRSYFCWTPVGDKRRHASEAIHLERPPVRLMYAPQPDPAE